MLLPHGDDVRIAPEKLVRCLLRIEHSHGRSKANFFRRVGYGEEDTTALDQALRVIAATGELVQSGPTQFGMKHVVDGSTISPSEREIRLRTV